MVHILGVLLPDRQLAKFALTHFYGVGRGTAAKICARAQVHSRCRVRNLNPDQIISLTAFLSAPSAADPLPPYPVAPPSYALGTASVAPPVGNVAAGPPKESAGDKLRNIRIMNELRSEIRDNIAHQRMIGSYVGRRHAMGLPVRGQNTQTNAKTAKKLNRMERYA
ncbi:37S ribosomal protein SWS2, mitochondrial [Sparassis crispa]|uniref:Small ribosomal subunit protein uS13m n=1 Tax=Sparassis crispa TaxID=139825 RepID=A0A401GJ96_9APHY|nr:37S ribosomal protein SWS2, mitochondrial [Sparassis crispa]GBE82215.1 37S ribosomal protein SWS2, mitochondrial [Sparassis crispa]